MLSARQSAMGEQCFASRAETKRALKTSLILERGVELKTTLVGMQRIKAICGQGADAVKVSSITQRMKMLNSVLQVLKNSFLNLARAQMDALLIGLTHSVTMRLEMLGGRRFWSRQEIAFPRVIGQI